MPSPGSTGATSASCSRQLNMQQGTSTRTRSGQAVNHPHPMIG
jgi:hypothetical protein